MGGSKRRTGLFACLRIPACGRGPKSADSDDDDRMLLSATQSVGHHSSEAQRRSFRRSGAKDLSGSNEVDRSKSDASESTMPTLNVMTLNLQYFSSFPADRAAGVEKLRKATSGADIIAVQEGINTLDVLSELGYDKVVCSSKECLAMSVREMVYDDAAALNLCPEHLRDQLLCNQIYVRRLAKWAVASSGAIRVSSNVRLEGGGDRCSGHLALRSMVWVKLQSHARLGSVYVMCTHISGGRFEDQYFVQQLAQERRQQVNRCMLWFEQQRPYPQSEDSVILVGDFNALAEYDSSGPMHGYFTSSIAKSAGGALDAQSAGLATEEALEAQFKEYMVSPFKTLEKAGWRFAYGQEVGVSSSFGHLIDHMAYYGEALRPSMAEIRYLTNQKFGNKPTDTDIVITDHNAVLASFGSAEGAAVSPQKEIEPRMPEAQRRSFRRAGAKDLSSFGESPASFPERVGSSSKEEDRQPSETPHRPSFRRAGAKDLSSFGGAPGSIPECMGSYSKEEDQPPLTSHRPSFRRAGAKDLGPLGDTQESSTVGARSSADGAGYLNIMTLNLQYFSSFPADRAAGLEKLKQATSGADVIAVQEGIAGIDVLSELGYDKVVCSSEESLAMSVRDMVYDDAAAVNLCPEHLRDQLLCNQIYIRRFSGWVASESGAVRVSSDVQLEGGGDRCSGRLALRSMVWAKLESPDRLGKLFVMCTHISGGRFEDQYFVQQLAQERRTQVNNCMAWFERRPNPQFYDAALLVGDFNALAEYDSSGPMHGYFASSIAKSAGVALDAQSAGLATEEALEAQFKEYMVSPFKTLEKAGWRFAYGQEVGVSSSFGHLIDHMAFSGPYLIPVGTEIRYLTNQKFGSKEKDTDIVITDHNAVLAKFLVDRLD